MPRRLRIKFLLTAVVALAIIPAWCLGGDVVMIANPSVPASELSRQDISNIYLGKKTVWSDGGKIAFAIQKGSEVHKAFLDQYLSKTASQFDIYWKKQMFTGKGSPPPSMDSDQAMIQFVSQTPGAIGYVSASADLNIVQKITVE